MGMDIYGIAPQIEEKQPQRPENWDSLTEYEREMFYNTLSIWESKNPGLYFRASYWSWRPIHAICEMAVYIAKLPFDTKGWDENSGFGLKTQLDCDILADAIDLYLMLNNANMHDMDDRMYLCLGSWCTAGGGSVPQPVQEELNETYKKGTILYNGIVAKDGTLVFSAHSCPLYHINNFTTFLRKCGGFEIW